MKLFDDTFSVLEKSLDLRLKRHLLISGNIANSETPNYRAREMDFAGELRRSLEKTPENTAKTHTQHLDIGMKDASHVILDNSGAMGADGNNVDLDIAMGKLSANARTYTSGVSYLNMKLRLLRETLRSIGGGI